MSEKNENPKVADAIKAIDHYASMLKSGSNPLGSGKKSDDQGAKRKKLGTEISTYQQWADKEKSCLEVIPTGISELDEATGIGGLPKGKMVELFGTESGGKSYIAYNAIASCQKIGGVAALLDVENAFTPEWVRTIGIDTDSLLYKNEPMSMEAYLQLAYDLCSGGFVDLIVIDSTAALVPQTMLDGVVGDQDVAIQARVLSPAVSKLQLAAPFRGKGGKQTCIVWINQIREKPGVMFGNPETTPGGRALKFYCHMRIDVRRGKIERVKKGEIEGPIYQTSTGTIIKNKLAIPGKKFSFKISFESNLGNPLVLLGQYVYEKKIFYKSKGEFKYRLEDEKVDPVPTGVADSVELGRWIHSQGLVEEIVARITKIDSAAGVKSPDFIEKIDSDTQPPLKVVDAETSNETSESTEEKSNE